MIRMVIIYTFGTTAGNEEVRRRTWAWAKVECAARWNSILGQEAPVEDLAVLPKSCCLMVYSNG